MPRAGRAPSFQFYPADFLADPAVACMTPAALGGYALLLCYAFLEHETGSLPMDEARLASLSKLNGDWPKHRDAILAAFELKGGRLVQKRMVEDHAARRRRHAQAVSGGKAAQKVLRDKRMGSIATSIAPAPARAEGVAASHYRTPPNQAPTLELVSTAPTPSSSVDSRDSKSTPSVRVSENRDWKEAFDLFWQKYREWRPDGKAEALKVWMSITPKGQDAFNRIDEALDRQIAEWKSKQTEPQYRPHCRTWLYQKRYLDFADDV